MNRSLRGLPLAGSCIAPSASGCSETPAPQSFSKNVAQGSVENTGAKAKGKVKGQNQQVRSFMVPKQ
jgi:hypothetical protein